MYLIERNYEQLPHYTTNDVDFLISKSDRERFISIALNIVEDLDKKIILVTTAYGGGRLYFLRVSQPLEQEIIRIDFMTHMHFRGIPLLNEGIILRNRQKRDIFYVPKAGMEAAISLIIPLIKTGEVKEKYKGSIYHGCIKDTENFVNSFVPFLPLNKIQNIVDLVEEKEFDVIEKQRRKILLSYILRNKYQVLSGITKFITSYFQRLINPSGLLVAVMGSDGSGKSSIINNLSESIKILYPSGRFVKFHWRPGVLPQLRTILGKSKFEKEFVLADPHSQKKRSRITSFLRWLYYSIDYIIGYYVRIFPMRIRTTAVVMDRYYYDIVVDPVRYGFNLPHWLLKSILPIIPKPDLTIYLDNDPQMLYKRKQELPVEELGRQVNSWREFIPSLPNAQIVTTDKTLDEVVREVTLLIIARRAEMTERMLKIDPPASKYLWKSEQGYVALPSKRDCRWIMPTAERPFKRSWDLYQPYSLKGMGYKEINKILFPINSLSAKKIIKGNSLNSKISENLRTLLVGVLKREDILMAISTGTPSPFRKTTGLIISLEGMPIACIKIGEKPLAIERIKNEGTILKKLAISDQLSAVAIKIPECLFDGEIENAHVLIQSPMPFEGKSGSRNFNDDYAGVLTDLINISIIKKKFTESEFYKELKDDIGHYPVSYRELLIAGLEYIGKNVNNKEVIFSVSHGDFAPWNMLWKGKEVFLYDWESATFEAPAGIDLVHFLFQTGFLRNKMRGKTLLHFIMNENHYKLLQQVARMEILPTKELTMNYLLRMAIDEDKPQLLSKSAVERRNLIKLLLEK